MFNWIRNLRVTSGAAILIAISFLFTAAVARIDNSDSQRFSRFQDSVCTFVGESNHNVNANRARVENAYHQSLKRANAEQDIANALALYNLPKLAHDETVLASQDRGNAQTLHTELTEVQAIRISGCS